MSSKMRQAPPRESTAQGPASDTISIVQRGNLKALEDALRRQWRLGQNIVLCWSPTDNGILILLVPHYFLGNYSAVENRAAAESNEEFIRQLISGHRRKNRDDFFEIANRLGVAPTFVRLAVELSDERTVVSAVEQLVKRYGISYVTNRAVLLFDIAEFSLYTPFEQASQLNSLSYSLNSAYSKLLKKGIEINFARTTTGDGYYVWNRDGSRQADIDLFHFLILVIADNKLAREASKGNTVPLIRCAYHIGSHYELYQAEGVNPTLFSYIVGNVTIELARMLDLSLPGQVYVGDFTTTLPDQEEPVESLVFLEHCSNTMERLYGIALAGDKLSRIFCQPAQTTSAEGKQQARCFTLTDKHGITRSSYSLQVELSTDGGSTLELGLSDAALPDAPGVGKSVDTSVAGTIDGHKIATLLKRAAELNSR
jgi:hypothetical protein